MFQNKKAPRKMFLYLNVLLKIFFRIKPRAYFIAATSNNNLGDNAQLMCIEKWIKENYPSLKIIRIPISVMGCEVAPVRGWLRNSLISWVLINSIRITQRKGDVFFGNSGYHFVDHSSCWLAFCRIATSCRKTPLVIFPVTINFFNKWIGMRASKELNSRGDVTILCRDKVSYANAQELFSKCRILLFPDIVTSMIGTCQLPKVQEKKGFFFCLRNDGEEFYSQSDLFSLSERLKSIDEVTFGDTQPLYNQVCSDENREKLIGEFIEFLSKFKVIVTDRYHGTIFSVISSTPVVVVSSIDHKLSSGVKWYPETFSNRVVFAENLSDAYELALTFYNQGILTSPESYFKNNYYDKLKNLIEEN